MYEHRYKYGKQKVIMTVGNFKDKLEAAEVKLSRRRFLFCCGILEHGKARFTKESKMT
jgi:hypothetical protein